MSTTALSDLISRLQEDVPARGGIPSEAQCERLVKDAVADFGRRAGRLKIATLNVVSGTASYVLPDDFVSMVRLTSLSGSDGILNFGSGLIPVSTNWSERTVIAAGWITFYPTPAYTLERDYEYKAGWALDVNEAYLEMGDTEAGILLQLAAAKVLGLQASKAAQEAWQYQLGAERVSKEQLADKLRAQGEALRAQYIEAIQVYAGTRLTVASRARYGVDAYEDD